MPAARTSTITIAGDVKLVRAKGAPWNEPWACARCGEVGPKFDTSPAVLAAINAWAEGHHHEGARR